MAEGEEKTSWWSPEGGAGTRLELGPQPGGENAWPSHKLCQGTRSAFDGLCPAYETEIKAQPAPVTKDL